MSYFSIHNHSEYSNIRLLDAINKVSTLFNRAINLGLKGFAITDHEVLSSHVQAVQKYKELLKAGKITEDFRLVLGNEIYLIDDIEDYKENYTSATHQYYHFILVAKDEIGYQALKELSSTAWANSYVQRGMHRTPISKEQMTNIMSRYKGHIIASTACLGGELPRALLEWKYAEEHHDDSLIYKAKKHIDDFINYCVDTYGKENFFLEMQPGHHEDQIFVNRKLMVLAQVYNLKLIYSTDSHYESKEKRVIHKSYLNAMNGEREVDDFYATAYMMDIEEIYDYFQDYMTREYFDMVTQNTIDLMNMCEFYDLYKPQIIPNVNVCVYDKLNTFKDKYEYLHKMEQSDSEQDRYWVGECVNALDRKGLYNEVYLSRLNDEAKELWLISEKLDITMTQYYNTMQKIIEIVWDKGDSLVGPARGSATGFLSCYLLGITQMDPIKWNLPYWRLS